MRPRPDAAENSEQTCEARGAWPAASMRPRPDAAENIDGWRGSVTDFRLLQ